MTELEQIRADIKQQMKEASEKHDTAMRLLQDQLNAVCDKINNKQNQSK